MPALSTDKALMLSGVERLCALRYLRSSKERVAEAMAELQERILSGVDTLDNTNAHRALDADKYVLDGIVRKLWRLDETISSAG